MPLKLVFGLCPILAIITLCLLFWRVEEKLHDVEMCCIKLGLLVWAIGFWFALGTAAHWALTGQWHPTTIVAFSCFALTTLAFLEPIIRPHLRLR
ncbi:MAG: hypothetical protein C3F02_02975 [Parcubacteria group bacterium]|nr:MAG: hypothetical protein C3F02_02975 [Parcubacteria group bacterium]